MAGNVWEWTDSPWTEGSRSTVLRGGSFGSNWDSVRVANRISGHDPLARSGSLGFRCAGVAPGEFLEGQVRLVHGRDAGA